MKQNCYDGEEIGGMIGDVNLFLYSETTEVEIMIAESEYRRKGLAKEALELMLEYGKFINF